MNQKILAMVILSNFFFGSVLTVAQSRADDSGIKAKPDTYNLDLCIEDYAKASGKKFNWSTVNPGTSIQVDPWRVNIGPDQSIGSDEIDIEMIKGTRYMSFSENRGGPSERSNNNFLILEKAKKDGKLVLIKKIDNSPGVDFSGKKYKDSVRVIETDTPINKATNASDEATVAQLYQSCRNAQPMSETAKLKLSIKQCSENRTKHFDHADYDSKDWQAEVPGNSILADPNLVDYGTSDESMWTTIGGFSWATYRTEPIGKKNNEDVLKMAIKKSSTGILGVGHYDDSLLVEMTNRPIPSNSEEVTLSGVLNACRKSQENSVFSDVKDALHSMVQAMTRKDSVQAASEDSSPSSENRKALESPAGSSNEQAGQPAAMSATE
jgi:hypothetical protein